MKAALTLLIAAVILVVGGGGLYFVFVIYPVHTDPAAVLSAADDVAPGYTTAVEKARRLVRALLVHENLPGLSMAVAVDGRVVWAEGFGWADLEHHVPVAPQTRFRIGTASTALTSAGVGLLIYLVLWIVMPSDDWSGEEPEPLHEPVRWVARRRGGLCDDDGAALVHGRQVGEGAADVDPDPVHRAHAGKRSAPGSGWTSKAFSAHAIIE